MKQIGKLVGVKVTKNTVAKGISKAIPVVGGVISGGLNLTSMLPMAKQLVSFLDKVNFDYSEEENLTDYEEIQNMTDNDFSDNAVGKGSVKDRAVKGVKNLGNGLSGIFAKEKKGKNEVPTEPITETGEDVFAKIEKLARLKGLGAIAKEEYDAKKENSSPKFEFPFI